MGYRFRARIEHRVKRDFRGERNEWRWVGEYHHMAWADEGPGMSATHGRWTYSREDAQREANAWLDSMAAVPDGEYV